MSTIVDVRRETQCGHHATLGHHVTVLYLSKYPVLVSKVFTTFCYIRFKGIYFLIELIVKTKTR